MKHLIKPIFLSVIFLWLTAFSASAQKKKPKNLSHYDNQIIHFGFSLGVNSGNFVAVNNGNFHSSDTSLAITPSSSAGFHLGIVTNLHMGDLFDLRFIPSLSFVNRDLTYTFIPPPTNSSQIPTTTLKSVASTFVEFPLELKFKSRRINNYRMYVIAGFKYSKDLASKKADKTTKDKQPLKISGDDYGYEIGFGMDFYLDYIKFSPEIKMFNGLTNVLVKDDLIYSTSLDQLRSKIFTFSITFE